eukprot:5039932-Amphidinium_carterae.1
MLGATSCLAEWLTVLPRCTSVEEGARTWGRPCSTFRSRSVSNQSDEWPRRTAEQLAHSVESADVVTRTSSDLLVVASAMQAISPERHHHRSTGTNSQHKAQGALRLIGDHLMLNQSDHHEK